MDSTTEVDYGAMSNQELCAQILTWENPWFGAVPYVAAIREMLDNGQDPITEPYYFDGAGEIVLYFRANAAQWRGPVARAVKAELKKRGV